MGSTEQADFDIYRVLEDQDLTRIRLKSWYLIYRADVRLSEEGDPYQDLVLFYEPDTRSYVLRIFSRTHLKGRVESQEEFEGLIANSFGEFKPCFGLDGDLSFAEKCLKVAEEGAKCSECRKSDSNPSKKLVIKREPDVNLEDDFFDCPLCNEKRLSKHHYSDHLQNCEGAKDFVGSKDSKSDSCWDEGVKKESTIASDFVEANYDDDDEEDFDDLEYKDEVREEKVYYCTFCVKQYASVTLYAQHLLKAHNEEPNILPTWFDLNGTDKKKADVLYSIKIGEFTPKIDWERGKTSDMESLLEKYSDKIAKLRESRSKWPHTTKKGAKRKAPMASSRSEDKKRQIDYQKHFTKNADGTRDCNLCSMNLKQRHAAASHIKLKHGFNSNYKCHLCQKPFEFPVPLASHMFEYHAEVLPHQATCVICHGAVTFEKNRHDVYNDHVIGCMKTFENQKKYIWKMNGGLPPCDICNKEFTSDCSKRRHMVREHGHTPPFQCEECSYWCLFEGEMKKHKNIHLKQRGEVVGADNEMLYTACHICGKSISGGPHTFSFKEHLMTHEVQQFPCKYEDCDVVLPNRKALSRHVIKVHSTDPKYQCQICGLKQPVARLKKHMEQVHGEAKHECKLCGKRLKSPDGLVTHMRTHTGETPFSCKLCTYTCKSSATLSAHKKHVHNGGRSLLTSPLPIQDADVAGAPKVEYTPGHKLPFEQLRPPPPGQQQQSAQLPARVAPSQPLPSAHGEPPGWPHPLYNWGVKSPGQS